LCMRADRAAWIAADRLPPNWDSMNASSAGVNRD